MRFAKAVGSAARRKAASTATSAAGESVFGAFFSTPSSARAAVLGAAGGALYGAMADDTSVIGGALMGAGAGVIGRMAFHGAKGGMGSLAAGASGRDAMRYAGRRAGQVAAGAGQDAARGLSILGKRSKKAIGNTLTRAKAKVGSTLNKGSSGAAQNAELSAPIVRSRPPASRAARDFDQAEAAKRAIREEAAGGPLSRRLPKPVSPARRAGQSAPESGALSPIEELRGEFGNQAMPSNYYRGQNSVGREFGGNYQQSPDDVLNYLANRRAGK